MECKAWIVETTVFMGCAAVLCFCTSDSAYRVADLIRDGLSMLELAGRTLCTIDLRVDSAN